MNLARQHLNPLTDGLEASHVIGELTTGAADEELSVVLPAKTWTCSDKSRQIVSHERTQPFILAKI
jgi:hypothetical protein